MFRTYRPLEFFIVGPMIVILLLVINLLTTPGVWWVQWAALGIGIAWIVSLLRVLRAAILAGGLLALIALIRKSSR